MHPILGMDRIGWFIGAAGAIASFALLTACGSSSPESTLASYGETASAWATAAPASPGEANAGRITLADGYIAAGDSISLFDAGHPAIAKLDPALREAVREAARDAEADGVDMFVTAGWRSERYQASLLEQAIRHYASREEASKWVATPDQSQHVSGDAVDIGPTDADSWLRQHGADYGLCQTYANEMWHFELVAEPGGTCPRPVRDASVG